MSPIKALGLAVFVFLYSVPVAGAFLLYGFYMQAIVVVVLAVIVLIWLGQSK